MSTRQVCLAGAPISIVCILTVSAAAAPINVIPPISPYIIIGPLPPISYYQAIQSTYNEFPLTQEYSDGSIKRYSSTDSQLVQVNPFPTTSSYFGNTGPSIVVGANSDPTSYSQFTVPGLGGSATSDIFFDFEVLGPPGPVELESTYNISCHATSSVPAVGGATSQASIVIDYNVIEQVECAAMGGPSAHQDSSATFWATADAPYVVQFQAQATAIAVAIYTADAGASLDPSITIDPAFAKSNDYRLVFSPGVTPESSSVPEPSSSLLLLVGLIMLGLFRQISGILRVG
jgi:hypothetical protein